MAKIQPNGALIVPLQDGRSLEEPLGTSESADCIMASMRFFLGAASRKRCRHEELKRHGEVHKIIDLGGIQSMFLSN